MFEVLSNRDLRDSEPVAEIGDADSPVDLDRTPNRVVPQGGLESDGLIQSRHDVP
jgi:hypothetical protein